MPDFFVILALAAAVRIFVSSGMSDAELTSRMDKPARATLQVVRII